MDFFCTAAALKEKGYTVSRFACKEEAARYVEGLFCGDCIGFGDSETISQMQLYELLSAKNTVIDPKHPSAGKTFLEVAGDALTTEYFFTSANALTEDGILVNLDGTGNRVAGSLFGHRKVFYIIGRNKLAPTLEQAVWRVRNIAAPKNARRLKLKTPCAVRGDRCYDCSSPDRICNGLLIQLRKMNDMETEILFIDEDLGF